LKYYLKEYYYPENEGGFKARIDTEVFLIQNDCEPINLHLDKPKLTRPYYALKAIISFIR